MAMVLISFFLTLLISSASTSFASEKSCLPVASETDLVTYVMAAPFAGSSNSGMKVWETDSKEWQAARQAALAWAAGDCEGFLAAARIMSYEAKRLRDAVSGHSYWVLRENSQNPAYQGVFVFRAPEEKARARGVVMDAPHLGSDYHPQDGSAIRIFRDTGAVAFLQNTAHRCSLKSISGCSAVTSVYTCGAGGMRDSDVVHAVRNGFYAVYDGIESTHDYFHFEYHGSAKSTNAPGCSGTVHLSQASSLLLPSEEDEGTFPNRLWIALEQKLGASCVCYHQREKGCLLNGAASTSGRRTNADFNLAASSAANACLVKPTGLSKRFAHFEAYHVSEHEIIQALQEAVR